ncbi:conserved hypothetical protein [Talaromyces stipitatus ATCC 10500]|uniref:Uncharacterized protein n=1 Tax=Talaromyces stipitatus (strain ATCC 10500 / CBS 375.48 / QM 6759 / NRRL 1006) TaxID=441959 RepID=B8MLA4_TALSN|nr:uncharacterized protein TSTA_044830 [Talaromyces stipitatus ATCC 10500]EED15019.1 conserved hypothetical protein [Talaromyces stipitatus ATCC 10500]
MSKCRGLASHLALKRQPCYRRRHSNSAHGDSSASAASDSTAAPSQLLRYALSGDTDIHPTPARRYTTPIQLDKDLELILSKRTFGAQHQRGKVVSLPGRRVPTDLQEVSDLQQLNLWFEQYVAAGCQLPILDDLLSDALVRLRDEGAEIPPAIRLSGLYYACQSLSVPAIRYHLKHLLHIPSEYGKRAEDLAQCLLRTVRTVRFSNPAYDTRPILELVAEPIDNPKQKTVFSRLPFSEGMSTLIELLCELGATNAHKDVWDALMRRIEGCQRSRTLSWSMVDDAYKSVLVFFKFGMTEYGVSCMNQISKTVKKMSPSLQIRSELAALLNKKGIDVPPIIEVRIQATLRRKLKQQGTKRTDDVKVGDDMMDFSMVLSLLEHINNYGTSVSASEIANVIDSLNECAGLTIPLFKDSSPNRSVEYAWSPQWVPGVSSSAIISFSQNSQTLGLLRAQIASRGIIFSPERSRNLVQLGHLVRRELISGEQGETTPEDGPDTWTKTGYLVVFDRVSAEYLLIYLGEDIKIIDPEYRPHSGDALSGDFEKHTLIGSLAHISMPKSVQHLNRGIGKVITPVKNSANRYVLDLDSGANLRP